jgi:prohibitin 1
MIKTIKVNKRFIIGAVITGIVIFGGLIYTVATLEKVEPGYAGIVYNMNGGIEKETLSQGYHLFISPTKKVKSYPVSLTTVWLSKSKHEGKDDLDESFNVGTSDGKPVTVNASFTYSMNATDLPWVFTNFKGANSSSIEDTFMKAQLKNDMNKISSTYGISEIYGSKRDEIAQKALEVFKKNMANYKIVVHQLSITDVVPDPDTMKSIQNKVNAEQQSQQAIIQQKIITTEAGTALIKANGDAAAKIAQAQGEATANKSLLVNMSPELIQYKQLEVQAKQADAMAKWNVNTYVSGGNGATPFLNIPAPTPVPAAATK